MSDHIHYISLQSYQPSDKVNNILQLLLENSDQPYYELQQQYKLHATRLFNKKHIIDGLYVLYHGAVQFTTHRQYNAGHELAMIYCNKCFQYIQIMNQQLFDDLLSIIYADSTDTATNLTIHQCNITYLKSVLKYVQSIHGKQSTNNNNESNNTNDQLNEYISIIRLRMGYSYMKLNQYKSSNVQYILGMVNMDVYIQQHLELIQLWCQQCNQSIENQYIVCRTILQYLALNKLDCAISIFHCIQHHISYIDNQPLTHYIMFLLQLIQCNELSTSNDLHITTLEHKQKLYESLCHRYQPLLSNDTQYQSYLNKIGELYFHMKSAQNSMIESIMSNFS